MSVDPPTAGQQRLIEALDRLAALELGTAEPAPAFRPFAGAGTTPSAFDLAALGGARQATSAEHAAEGAAAPTSSAPQGDAEAAAATDVRGAVAGRADTEAAVASTVPPPCAGVAETVAAVCRGELSPADLLQQIGARIDALDGRINAIVARSPERAAREAATVAEVLTAGERPRPLSGVPLVHKDVIATGGVATTGGSELLRGHVPDADAAVAARLANAGTLMVGKANTHELATGVTGTVSCFGPTRNPWNPEHIAGGSSSGSAAALAAGFVAAATGTDTGGSIRLPSACCGTVGLKPTYGRVSRVGVLPFAWSLDHVGPMGRRVHDVAALLNAMAGHDPNDPASAAEPATDFTAALATDDVEGVRFALPASHFLDLATAPVAAAVRSAAARLEACGARRVEVALPDDLRFVAAATIALFLAEGGAVHREAIRRSPQSYAPETRDFFAPSDRVSAHHYLQAQRLRSRLARAMARVFQEVDVLLTPTIAMTAPRRDAAEVELPSGQVDVRAAMTLFTRPFNLTGLPALSLPCGFDNGLPIGLQIVGRPFDEAMVLRVAHAYETASAWHERRPPGFA